MPFTSSFDGTKIYYEVHGSGKPILFIMGQGRDHQTWKLILDDFIDRYQAIIYDHRGTGRSDKPLYPPYTTRDLAKDAIAILDELNIQSAHVYGISMGGRVGQWIAIDHPERLISMALGCSSLGNKHGIVRSKEVDNIIKSRNWLKREYLFISPEWKALNPDIYSKWKQAVYEQPVEALKKLHYQASEMHDTWDYLPKIRIPVLVIHGEDDAINPVPNAYILSERIFGSRLYIVKGGRHEYFMEFREESSKIVLDFFDEHSIGR